MTGPGWVSVKASGKVPRAVRPCFCFVDDGALRPLVRDCIALLATNVETCARPCCRVWKRLRTALRGSGIFKGDLCYWYEADASSSSTAKDESRGLDQSLDMMLLLEEHGGLGLGISTS